MHRRSSWKLALLLMEHDGILSGLCATDSEPMSPTRTPTTVQAESGSSVGGLLDASCSILQGDTCTLREQVQAWTLHAHRLGCIATTQTRNKDGAALAYQSFCMVGLRRQPVVAFSLLKSAPKLLMQLTILAV